MDEAPGLANDAGAARIIVRMGGYLVGTLGNEVSARGNEGSPRGNEGLSRGNHVYPAGNVVVLELPPTGTSSRLYDLWLRILPPQEPGVPLRVKLVEGPDSIQVTQATFDDATSTLTVIGTSNKPGNDTTPWWMTNTYNSATLPTPATDQNTISYMTVSVDDGASPDTTVNPLVDPFILEVPMTFVAGNIYQAIIPIAAGNDLDGRRLSIQTDEGGVNNVIIQ